MGTIHQKVNECSFVFLFELIIFLGKFPRISAGASLLSCSLFWRSVLKFHGEGTLLIGLIFNLPVHRSTFITVFASRFFVKLYFTKRRTFTFSDVCFTQGSPCESYSSTKFQHSFKTPPEIVVDSGGSVSCDTQLNGRTLFTITTALLYSPFSASFWLFFDPPVRK